jgi:hypothetical protein
VLVPDVYLTGELRPENHPAGLPKVEFYAGYNRTTIANRAHDILTAIAALRKSAGADAVNLVGLEGAGPWCLLARPLAGDSVARLAADAASFDFEQVQSIHQEGYLPGSLKFGGLWSLASVAAPAELWVWNPAGGQRPQILVDAYTAAGTPASLRLDPQPQPQDIAGWIAR